MDPLATERSRSKRRSRGRSEVAFPEGDGVPAHATNLDLTHRPRRVCCGRRPLAAPSRRFPPGYRGPRCRAAQACLGNASSAARSFASPRSTGSLRIAIEAPSRISEAGLAMTRPSTTIAPRRISCSGSWISGALARLRAEADANGDRPCGPTLPPFGRLVWGQAPKEELAHAGRAGREFGSRPT